MGADWDRQLAVFAETLETLPRLIHGVDRERLHRAPAPGEWSAHVVVCHLLLDELNTAMILRMLLTQDGPALVGIDADNTLCEPRFAPLYPETTMALDVWRALREDNVRLCASVSSDELERAGTAFWLNHRGLSFRHHVVSRERHDRAHLEQIRAALDA